MSSYAVNPAFRSDPVFGDVPTMWVGTDAPDGDRGPWLKAAPGSEYKRIVTANQTEVYEKVKRDSRDDDWVLVQGLINERVTYADFTDGGAAAGTKVLNATIPLGAYFEKTLISNVTAFSGDTSATLTVGDGTDVDRYNTGTPSIFTTDASVDAGVPSGTRYHDAAVTTITLTATSATDWGLVATTGALTVAMIYYGIRG